MAVSDVPYRHGGEMPIIEVDEQTIRRLGRERAAQGWTQTTFLQRLLLAIRDGARNEVPNRLGNQHLGHPYGGTWSDEENTVELPDTDMNTLQVCAGALGVSEEQALLRGIEYLQAQTEVPPNL